MNRRCCVCGGLFDSDDGFRCNMCRGGFHMALSIKAKVNSCGHYQINKQLCGPVFTCAACEQKLTHTWKRSVP